MRRHRVWRRAPSTHATTFIAVLTLLLTLVAPLAAKAQEAGKVARIGMLTSSPSDSDPLIEAFRQGLRELGYVEGRNITIEYRGVAADLVRLKVDVIVTSSRVELPAAADRGSRRPPWPLSVGVRRTSGQPAPVPTEVDPMPEPVEAPAATLMRLTNGYRVSQAIHVAAERRLADFIGGEPVTADEFAPSVGAHAALIAHFRGSVALLSHPS